MSLGSEMGERMNGIKHMKKVKNAIAPSAVNVKRDLKVRRKRDGSLGLGLDCWGCGDDGDDDGDDGCGCCAKCCGWGRGCNNTETM